MDKLFEQIFHQRRFIGDKQVQEEVQHLFSSWKQGYSLYCAPASARKRDHALTLLNIEKGVKQLDPSPTATVGTSIHKI